MPRPPCDPLAFVPSPDVVRVKLAETVALAHKLRVLLRLSERLHADPDRRDACPAAKAVTRG